ncbi:MAG: TonB-dependent receptor [Bacteroidota bacterium]
MMQLFNKMLLTVALCATASFLLAQTVTGVVTDDASGEALIGANVLVKGTTQGTITDIDGSYSLEIDMEDAVLIFSYTGYQTQEIPLGNQTTLDVQLGEGSVLDEVVVVGYGTQKKGDLTSAIANISSEEIEVAPITSVEQAMQGRSAGVQITSSTGQPGAALNVRIRGATSITASSDPLYVIDGVPMVSENNSALFTGGYNFNSISDINPDDIESIQILKDASATAIYGARGANGVVLINTKRGVAGKGTVELDVYTGIQGPTRVIDMMDSRQFINMMNEAAANDGLAPDYFSNPDFGNFIGDPDDPELQNTDWYDEILRDDAPMTNYSLSARGGNQKVSYFTSVGYLDQEGYQKGTNFDRFSGRVNVDAQVSEKFKVGVSSFVARSDSKSTIGDNSLYGVMINSLAADPTMPVFQEDGSYSDPFSYYSWWAFENPRAATDLYQRNTITTRFLGSVYGEYELIPNLKLRSSWSADFQYLKDRLFYPSNTFQAIRSGNTGEGLFATAETLTWLNENILTYTANLGGDHNLDLLAGFTMQESQREISEINGQNFATNILGSLELASDITEAAAELSDWGLLSYLGRVNYNFKNKYYITSSVRVDGSSRFGQDNRYGVFPSVAVSWRASAEPFLQDLSWLYDLKIRASYGLSGNQEGIDNFASRSLWSLNGQYGGVPAIRPDQLGNSQLGWESTTQLDIGFDAAFVDGRVNLVFDYFNKSTTDLLLESIVPATSGYSNVFRNIGEVRNRGMEIGLNTVNINRNGFSWETSFNISTIDNEVIRLEQDNQISGLDGVQSHILTTGAPLGSFNLIQFEGVDPQTGNSIFTDANNDGVINTDDAMIPRDEDGNIKSVWPDFYGGLNNRISYKGFSLSVFLQFSKGNYLWNHGRYAAEQVGWSFNFGGFLLPYGNNTQRVEDERWRQPGDVTDVPRAGVGNVFDAEGNVTDTYQNWQENSDQWLEDASYLRVKNVEFSYQIPQALLQNVGLNNATLYFRGQNLATITNYLGVDPEVSSNGESVLQPGEDYGGLGQAKTYVFGVKLGF